MKKVVSLRLFVLFLMSGCSCLQTSDFRKQIVHKTNLWSFCVGQASYNIECQNIQNMSAGELVFLNQKSQLDGHSSVLHHVVYRQGGQGANAVLSSLLTAYTNIHSLGADEIKRDKYLSSVLMHAISENNHEAQLLLKEYGVVMPSGSIRSEKRKTSDASIDRFAREVNESEKYPEVKHDAEEK